MIRLFFEVIPNEAPWRFHTEEYIILDGNYLFTDKKTGKKQRFPVISFRGEQEVDD